MKATEMVRAIQNAIANHGDLQVQMFDHRRIGFFDVGTLELVPDGQRIRIIETLLLDLPVEIKK